MKGEGEKTLRAESSIIHHRGVKCKGEGVQEGKER